MAADAADTAARWQDGATVDITQEMMRLTLRIVARCLFSLDVEDREAREVGRALDAMDLAPGPPVEPDPRITLRPKNGIQVTLRRRG